MISKIRPFWRDALALVLSIPDKRTPWTARVAALFALAYAIAPVDLVPDIAPLLGIADDVLIVPTILALAAQTLPPEVLDNARSRSDRMQKRVPWLIPLLILLMLIGLGILIWGAIMLMNGGTATGA